MVIAKEIKCTTRKIEKPVMPQTKLTEKKQYQQRYHLIETAK